ncbi:Transferase [Kalmanozyma brasiliensis GHG001]|uniref:Transferase n=1 Tax=Kalmanozyma brasiliensis (strain GHG001) TaxID=1365824 RepID=UPI001CEBE451|nr:Transferase [Kalmanozyma brasiliensis GHG001]KAF6766853.1 Transferase [Kalmanozyma brasiliensis GHG001]
MDSSRLDVLGCQPSLFKLYTQIAFIYAIVDEQAARDDAIRVLRSGLDHLAAQLPWLSGHVVNEDSSPSRTGSYRIVESKEIPLVVQDLSLVDGALTLDELRNAQYPFSMLDEKLIASCMTLNLPGQTAGLVAETGPVLAAQANLVAGGLILTIVGQHNVMDMVGQATIMTWLSAACAGRPLTQEQLAIGNMDKSKAIDLFDEHWQPDEQWIRRLQVPAPSSPPSEAELSIAAPQSLWAYVSISAESVAALKRLATATKDPAIDYITSDDAVCAFIWKHLSLARATRLDAKAATVFARAVDLRSRLVVPATYPGTLTNMAYNESSMEEVGRSSLGQIASKLRHALNSPSVAHDTRALATVVNRLDDKGSISITAPVDPSTGIMLSSWASVKLHELDFNLGLGKPLAVRRPAFIPVESLMYMMPKSSSGETVVGMCLRSEDWSALMRDGDWASHVRYIG